MQEAVEREEAAFAVILRAQDKDRVFDGDDDGDGPNHQRNAAQYFVGRRPASPAEEQLIHRVKRRRTDIAVNNTQRSDGQGCEAATRPVRRARCLFGENFAQQSLNLL